MTECTHLRCIGPVACPVDIPEKIGIWRWVFCELCGAYKQWDAKDILERGYCPLCGIYRTTAQGDDRPRRLMAHMAQFQSRDVEHANLYEQLKTVYTVPGRTKCPVGL